MSIDFSINNGSLQLNKLSLPSRYMYYSDESYVKLLTIGEGIFAGDRLYYNICLSSSTLTVTTESATKIYKSDGRYAKLTQTCTLNNSNFEFINDELIMYGGAKFISNLRLRLDTSSTLFYADIMNKGRSYEDFNFSSFINFMKIYINDQLEYAERYSVSGDDVKDSFQMYNLSRPVFTKVLIRQHNSSFFDLLKENGFLGYELSSNGKLVIIPLISSSEQTQKSAILKLWSLYRGAVGQKTFNLGKY